MSTHCRSFKCFFRFVSVCGPRAPRHQLASGPLLCCSSRLQGVSWLVSVSWLRRGLSPVPQRSRHHITARHRVELVQNVQCKAGCVQCGQWSVVTQESHQYLGHTHCYIEVLAPKCLGRRTLRFRCHPCDESRNLVVTGICLPGHLHHRDEERLVLMCGGNVRSPAVHAKSPVHGRLSVRRLPHRGRETKLLCFTPAELPRTATPTGWAFCQRPHC